jgi:hypothetical protein
MAEQRLLRHGDGKREEKGRMKTDELRQTVHHRASKLLITYLLTPWCRVLLEKLTGLQQVKKFPAFYGTRRFITAFTSFRHPSLS